MKIQILQENLAKSLNISSRFVSSRATLPILSNILIKAQGTKILLQATNLESSISTSLGAKVVEEGTITVPAKVITDLITNLPKGPIELTSEREELSIHTDNFSATLTGANPADYPAIPSALGDSSVSVSSEILLKALTQTLFSVSNDESRPILTGLLFILEKESLTLVGTDGHRLSQRKIALPDQKESKRIILPKAVISELMRETTGAETISFSFSQKEKQALLGIGNAILTSRIIEGEFPNFERIIPKQSTVTVRLNKDELTRAVKVAAVFARDSGYIAKLKVGGGAIEISSESVRSGSQKAVVEAKIEGESLEVVYNIRFIEDFLNIADGEEIEIHFTDPVSPGVFLDSKNPEFLHLIMPMKI